MEQQKQIDIIKRRIESLEAGINELLTDGYVKGYSEMLVLKEIIPTAVNKNDLKRFRKDPLVKRYIDYIVLRESLIKTLERKLKEKLQNETTRKTIK